MTGIDRALLVSLLRLARLHAVFVGFFMFLLGALLACLTGAHFAVERFLLAYAVLVFAQISVSFSNDYFDVDTDRYSMKNIFSGGSKVLVEHPELRGSAKAGALGFAILSVAVALVFTLMFSFSFSFLLFVVIGNLIGWFYTAPPVKLSYRGLGEMTNMVMIGFVIPTLGYWAMSGGIDAFSLVFTVPFSLYGLALIIDVEVPDREADARTGKNNLVVRAGTTRALLLCTGATALASLYLTVCSFVIGRDRGIDFRVVALFSFVSLLTSLGVLIKRNDESSVMRRYLFLSIIGLFLLVLLMDVYLVGLVFF